MWFTPSSTARRRTARAVCGSADGPNIRGPASCIAPNPMRLIGLSPSIVVVFMSLPRLTGLPTTERAIPVQPLRLGRELSWGNLHDEMLGDRLLALRAVVGDTAEDIELG